MKRIVYFLLLAVVIMSCEKDDKEILNENIVKYVKENATDPASYQPVATRITETVHVNNFAQGVMNVNNEEIKLIKKDIQDLNKIIEMLKSNQENDKIGQVEKKIQKANKAVADFQAENKKLEKLLDNEAIAFVKVEHDCKLNNAKGELVDDHLFIIADSDYNIKLVKEKGKKNINQSVEFFKEKYLK